MEEWKKLIPFLHNNPDNKWLTTYRKIEDKIVREHTSTCDYTTDSVVLKEDIFYLTIFFPNEKTQQYDLKEHIENIQCEKIEKNKENKNCQLIAKKILDWQGNSTLTIVYECEAILNEEKTSFILKILNAYIK